MPETVSTDDKGLLPVRRERRYNSGGAWRGTTAQPGGHKLFPTKVSFVADFRVDLAGRSKSCVPWRPCWSWPFTRRSSCACKSGGWTWSGSPSIQRPSPSSCTIWSAGREWWTSFKASGNWNASRWFFSIRQVTAEVGHFATFRLHQVAQNVQVGQKRLDQTASR